MNAKKNATTVCLTCKKTIALEIIFKSLLLVKRYPDGINFTCSRCGRLIAQLFQCPSCKNITIKDLTVEYTQPDICANFVGNQVCRTIIRPKHGVELPIVS